MKCSNCGSEATGKFCNECGAPLIPLQEDKTEPVAEVVEQTTEVNEDASTVSSESPDQSSIDTKKEVPDDKKKKSNLLKIIIPIAALLLVGAGLLVFFLLNKCEHEWEEATCIAPKTCKLCGATEGEPSNNHVWEKATTTKPKTCKVCGKTEGDPLIAIPDVKDLDEDTAKSLVAGKGLIPKMVYEYDDYTEEGCVIKTSPSIGSGAVADDVVTIYISKGPEYILSKASTIQWQNIGVGQDEWHFYSPYIEDETLYIECTDVAFAEGISWKDEYNKGHGFGTACVTDVFDKTVPVVIRPDEGYSTEMTAGVPTSFTLEIPLSDLDVSKPTTMYLSLSATKADGSYINIKVNFTMTW